MEEKEAVKINYLPSFQRTAKKLGLDYEKLKEEIRQQLQRYVDEYPESLYFPKSGAGIGNVWKLRIDGSSGYRAIYYAIPRISKAI